ncbi:recombinase family protein [Acetobacterium fimetarium]|nr:recombinase family protein [Acetobacterium fimetarium]
MAKKGTIKRAVGYARVSTDMQNESSIDAQIYGVKEYCEKHGYCLVNTYIDFGISGTTDQRPQFQQMIEDGKKGQFDAVIVHKGDRFARSRNLSSTYKEILAKNNIEYISVTECFGNEPESVLLEGLTEAMAEYYSRNLAREVRKGLLQKARDCLYTGGNLPLGYDIDPETQKFILAKNEDEIKTVQTIFKMKAEGYGYGELIQELNRQGLNQSKKGGTLSKSAINWMLHNERYTGMYVYDRSAAKGPRGRNGHKYKNEEDTIRIDGGVPQIIDKETFRNVQEILTKNKKKSGTFKTKHPNLLGGIIECECGHSYVSNYRKERPGHRAYASYQCNYQSSHKDKSCKNKGIEQTTLDSAILDLLYTHIYDDVETITAEFNRYRRKKLENIDLDTDTIQRQITAIEIKINNITDAIAQGMNQKVMFDKMETLHLEKQQLENDLIDVNTIEETVEVTEDEIRELLEKTKVMVRTKSIPEVRRFINRFIQKVVVHTDNVEVTFKVAFLIGEKWTPACCFTKWLSREAIKFNERLRKTSIA